MIFRRRKADPSSSTTGLDPATGETGADGEAAGLDPGTVAETLSDQENQASTDAGEASGDGARGDATPEAADAGAPLEPAPGSRSLGPWDLAEVDDPSQGRIDLGGIWLPGVESMQLAMQVDEATQAVVAATIVVADSWLQLQPYAAPRKSGIWPEIRAEIAEEIVTQGGQVLEVQGSIGTELQAVVPVVQPDGTTAGAPVRFLGVDGPRWFLRGVITGRATVDAQAAALLEQVFRNVVVVRGAQAMAPREPILLHPPVLAGEGVAGEGVVGEGVAGSTTQERPPLDPFTRGPEITEIR